MLSPSGLATPTARLSIIPESAFSSGDIVWVPFPFVDAPRLRERPALVVSALSPLADIPLLWVLMITSAANQGWQGDISLAQCFAECGLPVPCVIRTAKIATVEAGRARKSGTMPAEVLNEVRSTLERLLF